MDASRTAAMLPTVLELLVNLLVAMTMCLTKATQGGEGFFGWQLRDIVHCGKRGVAARAGSSHCIRSQEPENGECYALSKKKKKTQPYKSAQPKQTDKQLKKLSLSPKCFYLILWAAHLMMSSQFICCYLFFNLEVSNGTLCSVQDSLETPVAFSEVSTVNFSRMFLGFQFDKIFYQSIHSSIACCLLFYFGLLYT